MSSVSFLIPAAKVPISKSNMSTGLGKVKHIWRATIPFRECTKSPGSGSPPGFPIRLHLRMDNPSAHSPEYAYYNVLFIMRANAMKWLKFTVLVFSLFLFAGCSFDAEGISSSSKTESVIMSSKHIVEEESPLSSAEDGITLPYPPKNRMDGYPIPESLQEKYAWIDPDSDQVDYTRIGLSHFFCYEITQVSDNTVACMVKYSTSDTQSWTHCDVYYITGDTIEFIYTIKPEGGMVHSIDCTTDKIYWANILHTLYCYTISTGETYQYSKPIPSCYFYYIVGNKFYYSDGYTDRVFDLEQE